MKRVEDLVVIGEDTVIACVSDGFAASFDQGRTWTRRTRGLTPSEISAMAIDSIGTILVISRENGVFRSTDLGENWQKVDSGILPPVASNGSYKIADVCYNDIEHSWYIASIDGMVLKSIDDGDSWDALLVDSLDGGFTSITATENGNVIVCGYMGVYTWVRDRAEWRKTADEGRYLQRAGSRLYATIDWGGYLASEDNGVSWQLNPGGEGLVGHVRIFDLGKGELIICGSTMLQYGRTYHSPDSGRSWEEIHDLSEYANSVYSIVRLPSGALIAGMGHGMMRSDSTLQKWQAVNKGWQYGAIFDIALTSNKWIFAVGREGIHFLDESLTAWMPSLSMGYVRGIVQHSEGSLLAATWPGVLRSTDQGNTWDSLILGYNQLTFLLEDDRGVVYGGLVDSLVYRSGDAGASWSAGVVHIPQSNVNGVVSHGGFVYILTADEGLYRIDSTLRSAEHLLAASVIGDSYALTKDNKGYLVVSGRNGLFLSKDGGWNWERLQDPEPRTCLPVMMAMESQGTLSCLFQMYDGPIDYSVQPENLLYRTMDYGQSWAKMPLPQPFQQYTLLSIPDDGKLYLASQTEGLFRTRNAVTSIEQRDAQALPDDHSITAWPQPAHDRLMLMWQGDTKVHTLLIHDCIGRQVLQSGAHADAAVNHLSLDVRGLQPGMYVVSLVADTEVLRKAVFISLFRRYLGS